MTDLPPIPIRAYQAAHYEMREGRGYASALEAAYPHIAEAVLRWAADELEDSARKAIDRQQQIRSPRSKRESAIQTRIGHGSAAFIGAARTLRTCADEIKETSRGE